MNGLMKQFASIHAGAHSPGIDAMGLGDPSKPNQVALCQRAADYSDMVARPKEAMAILTQRGGLAGGPRAEVKHAKEGFGSAPPLEEAVCGVPIAPRGDDAEEGGPATSTPAVAAVGQGTKEGVGKL